MENKPYPRTKESMKNLLKAKLECKGCIGNCIPNREGWCNYFALSAEDANSTALLQIRARMNEATEPGCLEELNPQPSGQAVA